MRYLTVSQTAELLQLSVPTVKRYIYDGKLRSTKLPGGQHRIPEDEVARLLSVSQSEPGAEAFAATPDATPEERLAVLERWVTELEAEVERLSAGLAVISGYCSLAREGHEEKAESAPAQPHSRIQVLGPGCKRCNALYELTIRVLREQGHDDIVVEQTKDLDEIAAFGPVLTPGLVIDDELVLSGRVPSEQSLKDLLARHLS